MALDVDGSALSSASCAPTTCSTAAPRVGLIEAFSSSSKRSVATPSGLYFFPLFLKALSIILSGTGSAPVLLTKPVWKSRKNLHPLSLPAMTRLSSFFDFFLRISAVSGAVVGVSAVSSHGPVGAPSKGSRAARPFLSRLRRTLRRSSSANTETRTSPSTSTPERSNEIDEPAVEKSCTGGDQWTTLPRSSPTSPLRCTAHTSAPLGAFAYQLTRSSERIEAVGHAGGRTSDPTGRLSGLRQLLLLLLLSSLRLVTDSSPCASEVEAGARRRLVGSVR